MGHSVVLAVFMIFAEIQSKSTENFYAPSTIIFHDIYTGLPTANEEDQTSTEDYTINSNQQLVEFHPLMTETSTIIPPPKYILGPFKETKIFSTTTSTTTEDPENTIKIVPVKKIYQRGLLDLLFPPKRVRSFKNVFDSIRKVLSHTFRR